MQSRQAPDQELSLAARDVSRGDPASEPGLRDLCTRFPRDPRPHFLLGALHQRLARHEEAIACLDIALSLDPDHVQAASAKALVLDGLGRGAEAEAALEGALRRRPAQPQLLANLGVLREKRGDFEGALAAYDEALRIEPLFRPARLNRGYVLSALKRLDDARANNVQLAEAFPDDPAVHYNLAEALLALGRYEEAIAACDRVLQLEPAHVKAHIDRALASAALGRIDSSQRDLDRALALDPEAVHRFKDGFGENPGIRFAEFDARSLYLHALYQESEACNWSRREEFIAAVQRIVSEAFGTEREVADRDLPFMLFSVPVSADIRMKLAGSVAREFARRTAIEGATAFAHSRRARPRIRVGYISPDFGSHPTGFLTRRMYALHDRDRFEVFAYSLRPSDGSPVRRDIEAGCDVFRDVAMLPPREVAAAMHGDGIDIAVDLAGYGAHASPGAFVLRPAPVQVGFLAYPATLGAEWIDYAIVDGTACPPGADAQWREKLVRLPYSYFITNNCQAADDSGLSRSALGLPETGFVFCSFNNTYKIDPDTFGIWMRLLAATPESVLWMYVKSEATTLNLCREAKARGIDPGRLVFATPWAHERHLGRFRFADLLLDTRYCNAHTTAVDALWAGVPVVTVPGDAAQARVGASLLNAAGMPELVCRDFPEYEKKALLLAHDPGELRRVKAKLAANRMNCELFDTEGRVAQLEAAYQEMWRRFEQGLNPESFDVAAKPQPPVRNRWH